MSFNYYRNRRLSYVASWAPRRLVPRNDDFPAEYFAMAPPETPSHAHHSGSSSRRSGVNRRASHLFNREIIYDPPPDFNSMSCDIILVSNTDSRELINHPPVYAAREGEVRSQVDTEGRRIERSTDRSVDRSTERADGSYDSDEELNTGNEASTTSPSTDTAAAGVPTDADSPSGVPTDADSPSDPQDQSISHHSVPPSALVASPPLSVSPTSIASPPASLPPPASIHPPISAPLNSHPLHSPPLATPLAPTVMSHAVLEWSHVPVKNRFTLIRPYCWYVFLFRRPDEQISANWPQEWGGSTGSGDSSSSLKKRLSSAWSTLSMVTTKSELSMSRAQSRTMSSTLSPQHTTSHVTPTLVTPTVQQALAPVFVANITALNEVIPAHLTKVRIVVALVEMLNVSFLTLLVVAVVVAHTPSHPLLAVALAGTGLAVIANIAAYYVVTRLRRSLDRSLDRLFREWSPTFFPVAQPQIRWWLDGYEHALIFSAFYRPMISVDLFLPVEPAHAPQAPPPAHLTDTPPAYV